MKQRITNRSVEALKPGQILWDPELRGFGCRRVKRDRVYLLKYRTHPGRSRWYSIGPHGRPWTATQARAEALRLLTIVKVEKKDPAAYRDKTRSEPTLADFAERYLNEHCGRRLKPRTLAQYRNHFRNDILPAIGDIRLTELTRSDAERIHSAMSGSPVSANRALAVLSAAMIVAEKWGLRPEGTNPARHVERFKETARDRFLSPQELGRLGDALARGERGWSKAEWQAFPAELKRKKARGPEDPRALAAIRLLLFTGARRGEILGLRWEDVDLARGIARLPDSKTGPRNLSLPPPAVDILRKLDRHEGNSYILPGDKPGGQFVGLRKIWLRIRFVADLDGLTIHDLRHAFASVAAGAGESLYITGALLGHRRAETTQRYAHLADDPLADAARRTAERIAEAMGGKP